MIDLMNKKVLLLGPSKLAESDTISVNFNEFDYVVRFNLILKCYELHNQPKTDIIFINESSRNKLITEYNKNYQNRMILCKVPLKNLANIYGSTCFKATWNWKQFKKQFKLKCPYMGTFAIGYFLGKGCDVTYGGTDFYWTGFSDSSNYPDNYEFVPSISGKEHKVHSMAGDLRFIKNYLMTEYQGKLHLLPKTKYYFEKSLEKYGIV
mgnify:FL=1